MTSRWGAADRIAVEVSALCLVWAVSAVLLGLIGWFHWWLVAPISAAGFFKVRSFVPRATEATDIWWWLALTIAAASLVINGLNPGEHVLTGRDSGTYLATAGWLAEESTLEVDARRGPLGEVEGLGYVLPGFYEWVDRPGELEPQFMHAFPAMLGTLVDLGGLELSYWLNPGLGAVMLLLLFSLARRFMSAWAALLSILAVAFGLVFLYFARTPFSEMLMAVFLLSGLVALGEAEERGSTKLAALGGGLLGATVLARIDGVVVLIPVILYLSVRSRSRPEDRFRRMYRVTRYAVLAVAAFGLAESILISPAYVFGRAREAGAPLLVVVLLIIGDDILGTPISEFLKTKGSPRKKLLMQLLVAGSGLLLAYAWILRPQVLPGTLIGGDLAFVEAREGLGADPLPYRAMAVHWLSWYHGPFFILLAWIGALRMVKRSSDSSLRHPSWLVPVTLAAFSLLYFWRPSITPDQIWAMRRFLTVVIPLGALASAFSVHWLVADLGDRWPSWSRSLTVVLAVVLLLPPLLTTAPVWGVHEFRGLTDDMEELCEDIDSNTSVLVIDYGVAQHLVQSLRSFCGVPAAWTDPMSDVEIGRIRSMVESEGGNLAVMTLDGQGKRYLGGDYRRLEITLSRAPSTTRQFPVSIVVDQQDRS